MVDFHDVELRAPTSSPVPDDLSGLMDIATGAALGDRPPSSMLGENVEDEESGLGLSASEIVFHKWLFEKKLKEAKTRETMDSGSKEYQKLRIQVLEELEWKRQGIIDERMLMAEREEELKRLRLQLAAKRGWDAIRNYIKHKQDDKQSQAAKQQWGTLFKVAKDAGRIDDKTLLDLYERYGLLGWDSRAAGLPYNPMFPDKNYQLARERTIRQHQLTLEQESVENKDRAKAQNKRQERKERQERQQMKSSQPRGVSESPRPVKLPPLVTFERNNNGGLGARATTLLNIPTSPIAERKLRREQTTIVPLNKSSRSPRHRTTENSAGHHDTKKTAKQQSWSYPDNYLESDSDDNF